MINNHHKNRIYIGVIGAGKCNDENYKKAFNLGKQIADNDAVVVCGGKSGIMQAVCEGTKKYGGVSIGILPEPNRDKANEYLSFSLTTGMGQARNFMIVTSSDVIIAVSGGYGTLSEIAMAQKHSKPTIILDSWPLSKIEYNFDRSLLYNAKNTKEAVKKAMKLGKMYGKNKSN